MAVRACRYCKHYKPEPHTIHFEFMDDVPEYSGLCKRMDLMTSSVNAGDLCSSFVKSDKYNHIHFLGERV